MDLKVTTPNEYKGTGVAKVSANGGEQIQKKERKLIILLIRHGIRYPKQIPEGWPLEKEINQGEGALTEAGAKQSQKLGQRIKEKYRLDDEPFEYELVSTQSKRTIETARNFIKGLLGFDKEEEVIFNHE